MDNKTVAENKSIAKGQGTAKQFIVIFVPLMILTLLVIMVFLIQDKKIKKARLLLQEQKNVELLQVIAVNDLKSIFMDITYLAALPILHQMIEQDDSGDHLKLSDIFVDFSKSRALYDQIRFLDENGMEIIRVNYNQGLPVIVPAKQLQNKAKRYYFADTIRLEPGRIFVSPLDLNIEQGKIEQPLKPMIRFGTPIVDLKGRKQGIILLNYFGTKMIQHLEEASRQTTGQFMLLNSQGYWLKALDPKDEWGFMFDDRRERTLAKTDFSAWEKISSQKSGQFINKNGIYTFSTIFPVSYGMYSSTGSGNPFKASEKVYSHNEYYWKIVSFLPAEVLTEQFSVIQFRWGIVYISVGLFLSLVSWLLASNMVRRKQAERSSIEKAMYLSNILNSSTEYAIATTDLDLCISYYNPMAEKFFGYTAAQVIGKKVQDIHTKKKVTPERFEQAVKQVRETGKYKYQFTKKIDQDICYISSELSGIYDADEKLVGFALFSKDETKRLSTEAALYRSEKQYRQLFENMTDVFYRLDQNGIVREVSPSALKLYKYDSIDEIIGKHAHEFVYNVKDSKLFQTKLQKKDHITNYIIQHKQKDGTPVFVETNSKTVFDADGNPNGELGIFRDITERVQAEEEKKRLQVQLQQAQKMETIGTLAGGIAHDFNNILFPILGHTEMLLEDIPEESPHHDGLNEIYHASLRARELVQQILTFSRQQSSELMVMQIQPAIKEALKLIKSTIPATIQIKQDIRSDCGVIKADPTQIHQIILNLATNAYHAMEKTGGELKVSLKEVEIGEFDIVNPDMKPGVFACLTISDTGMGMDKDLTKKIFDPFFTTKEVGKGTGMGLSVVHGIVSGMGGAIHVYSEPGKGAEFNVYFPIKKSSFEKQIIQIHEPIQGGTERVLLVDDEETIVTIEKLMLERLGYQVTARTSSIEALEAFRADPNKFDIIITDMAMPNMPGEKFAVELLKIRPDIPILLCTGFSETMSEEAAAPLGIKGFLLKPIVMKDFSRKIREVLNL